MDGGYLEFISMKMYIVYDMCIVMLIYILYLYAFIFIHVCFFLQLACP